MISAIEVISAHDTNFQVIFTLPSNNGIQRKVRHYLLQLGIALVLAVCIWGHISELFDHWDNTFRTGNDVEYSTVIVALIVGTVICVAQLSLIVFLSQTAVPCLSPPPAMWEAVEPTEATFIGHSPPIALRI
ncbi:MAG TPA: hypothetical protein VJP02_11035 [Candidatus Sulfotelmatobacter sp.]|nr:hypothetical protein [Candidatus Sulfotelmatobacter sp.]